MRDKVVLVTGGAGNVGRVVTQRFLDAGARVAVPVYKSDQPSALDPLRDRYPEERLFSFALDLTTERGAEQAIRQTLEWGGSLAGVAHMVGGYSGGTNVAETPMEVWARMVDLNMTSAYLVARFALPKLVDGGGGSLAFVSSRAAFEALAGRAAYAATKAGLVSFVKAIAEEYGPAGVRANVVIPDTIDTADNRAGMPDADPSRWTRPESVAEVIYFLVSDASRAVNGAAIPVYNPG